MRQYRVLTMTSRHRADHCVRGASEMINIGVTHSAGIALSCRSWPGIWDGVGGGLGLDSLMVAAGGLDSGHCGVPRSSAGGIPSAHGAASRTPYRRVYGQAVLPAAGIGW